MPYPSEHAARLVEPSKFEEGSFGRTNNKFGAGIHAIFGRLKGEDTATLQSIRFDADKFTVAEAKKWLKDHDYKPIKFEPATETEERENKMKQGIFMRNYSAESKDVTIDVVGVIGWHVWYSAMRDILRQIPETAERVIFDIYSPGGDIWEGNAIIQEIGALKQKTVARVQMAASMATLIAVACHEREIAKNGRWLVHNPWAALQGDAEAMEKRAKELRDCELEAAGFYAVRTGKKPEDMLALMGEERWLTPKEALEFGFVQKINDPFDKSAYAELRAEIEAAGKWPKALAEISDEDEKEAEKFECECIKCGHTITSEKHCKDLKCEKCGGQMRRKERPGPGEDNKGKSMQTKTDKPKQEEGKANDVDTTGAESNGTAKAADAGQPADALKAEYARGFKDGKTEAETNHSGQLRIIADKVKDLTAKNEALDTQQRKFQGERDSARAQVEKLEAALRESTAKLEQMLAGGMKFSPAIDTWEDALKACGPDYVKARKQFPDLYRTERERAKANRK